MIFSFVQGNSSNSFFNNGRMWKSMVFGVKGAPVVGAKGTVINMIMNSWLTFPFLDMTWLDSNSKYHILN